MSAIIETSIQSFVDKNIDTIYTFLIEKMSDFPNCLNEENLSMYATYLKLYYKINESIEQIEKRIEQISLEYDNIKKHDDPQKVNYRLQKYDINLCVNKTMLTHKQKIFEHISQIKDEGQSIILGTLLKYKNNFIEQQEKIFDCINAELYYKLQDFYNTFNNITYKSYFVGMQIAKLQLLECNIDKLYEIRINCSQCCFDIHNEETMYNKYKQSIHSMLKDVNIGTKLFDNVCFYEIKEKLYELWNECYVKHKFHIFNNDTFFDSSEFFIGENDIKYYGKYSKYITLIDNEIFNEHCFDWIGYDYHDFFDFNDDEY